MHNFWQELVESKQSNNYAKKLLSRCPEAAYRQAVMVLA
jgi:hypothetical protein